MYDLRLVGSTQEALKKKHIKGYQMCNKTSGKPMNEKIRFCASISLQNQSIVCLQTDDCPTVYFGIFLSRFSS